VRKENGTKTENAKQKDPYFRHESGILGQQSRGMGLNSVDGQTFAIGSPGQSKIVHGAHSMSTIKRMRRNSGDSALIRSDTGALALINCFQCITHSNLCVVVVLRILT
jgi:hypothetical protein